MKFISKSSNLLVVLRPGMSAQPLTGTPAVPTLSVRFKDGVADVEQQEMVDMMISHPGFNSDFISSENIPTDPYLSSRTSGEPTHEVTELKFGTPVSRVVKVGDAPKLSPEMQKLVQDAAVELAKSMLPSMVENTLKNIVSSNKELNISKGKKRGRKPGRKPKTATEVVTNETSEVQE